MNFLIKFILLILISSCQNFEKFNLLNENKSKISKIPTDTLIVNNGSEVDEYKFMSLDKKNNLIWKSENYGDILVTFNGKVIEKYSNNMDFMSEIFDKDKVNFYKNGNSYIGSIKYYYPNSGPLDFTSSFTLEGNRLLKLDAENSLKTNLIKERVYIQSIKREFTNYYWLNESGAVIKSKQTFNLLEKPYVIFYK
tara:strand:- start:291 stop:875 length:585 start_codon:yes stop_codon:yes gene_type:complete